MTWISLEKLNAWPRSLRSAAQLFGEQHVGGRAVFDVEIVAHELAVGADDGALAAQDGANGAGDDAVPVQIAAAVEVAAAGDGDGQAVGDGVGLRDQVGAGLADVVGMAALAAASFSS